MDRNRKRNKKKSKKKRIILTFIAILMILVGVFLFFLPKINELLIAQKENVNMDEISHKDIVLNQNSGNKNFDQAKVEPIDMNGVILNKKDADMTKVVGQLVIPSLNKNIAIFDGLENNNLLHGACTLKPHQRMGTGNYAIAGHYMKNKDLLFGGVIDMKKGDKIRLSNMKNIYEYTVIDTKKVKDTDMEMVEDARISHYDGRALVSLMTCYYDENGYRYFVVGRFDKLYPYSKDLMLSGIK